MNDERKLDALLRDWAVSPPPSHGSSPSDEQGWDAAATAILGKAQAAKAIDDSEMDSLWATPALAPEPGEPQSQLQAAPRVTSGDKKMSDDRDPPSMAPRSLRKGGSLKELAQRVSKAPPSAASVPPPAPSPRTSSPDVAPATKASATPLSVPAPASTATPLPAPRESAPPASVPVAAAASVPLPEKPANDAGPRSKTPETLPTGQAPATKKSGGSMWGLVGGGLVALAAAAGVAVYLNHAKQTNPAPTQQAANTAPAPTAKAADTSDEAAGRVQAKDDRPKEDPNAIDVDKLGDATPDTSAEPALTGTLPGGARPNASAVASNDKDGPHRVDPDGTLDDAMKKAAGVEGEEAKDKPEAAAGDNHPKNLPDLPPTGSVTAAVGSVRGAARACVAGADSGSLAVITFGSSGAAQSVSVGGWAAGKPAEGCIRSALMGARVEPFTKPSFSAPMTIRP